MNKAIFLDRDGTINIDKKGYTYKIEDFELYEGVIEGLKLLENYKLFIITNQSGIGRGYYTEQDMHKFNNQIIHEFSEHNIKIDKIYFCPHTPEENCECRKPKIKFIKDAKKEFDIKLADSWVIGDHPSDINMGIQTNCKTIYLLTGHGKKHRNELTKDPDFIAKKMSEAIRFIRNEYDIKKKTQA
jgi:D-glycero-D-manno-heptose 1,7-bisphosphate phosphatase